MNNGKIAWSVAIFLIGVLLTTFGHSIAYRDNCTRAEVKELVPTDAHIEKIAVAAAEYPKDKKLIFQRLDSSEELMKEIRKGQIDQIKLMQGATP